MIPISPCWFPNTSPLLVFRCRQQFVGLTQSRGHSQMTSWGSMCLSIVYWLQLSSIMCLWIINLKMLKSGWCNVLSHWQKIHLHNQIPEWRCIEMKHQILKVQICIHVVFPIYSMISYKLFYFSEIFEYKWKCSLFLCVQTAEMS